MDGTTTDQEVEEINNVETNGENVSNHLENNTSNVVNPTVDPMTPISHRSDGLTPFSALNEGVLVEDDI